VRAGFAVGAVAVGFVFADVVASGVGFGLGCGFVRGARCLTVPDWTARSGRGLSWPGGVAGRFAIVASGFDAD
jgi:hypothetical protein